MTEKKSFITSEPGANVIKLFPSLNYRFCNKLGHLSLVKFSSLDEKHSSLTRKSVNHREKSFITSEPGANVIKFFSVLKLQIFVIS